MSCAFIHSAGSVLFTRNPARPRPALAMLQAEAATAGGVRIGCDPVTGIETRLLPWSAMPTVELERLLAFKRDVARGSSETFTWLSACGAQITARFADVEITATEVAHNVWSVDVLLELTG